MAATTETDCRTRNDNHDSNKPTTIQEHENSKSPSELPTEFRRFQDLPIEIRELIYEQSMLTGGHLGKFFGHRDEHNSTRHFPAPCYTSRKECSIATRIFIRHLGITLCCDTTISELHRFFSSLPDKEAAYGAVQHLTFDYPGRYCAMHHLASFELRVGPLVKDVYLMLLCPNLQSLEILVVDCSVTLPDTMHELEGNSTDAPIECNVPSCEKVVRQFRFQRILECTNLSKITFVVVDSFGGAVISALERMEEVAAWMEDRFQRRNGTKLEVEVRILEDDGVEHEEVDYSDDEDDLWDRHGLGLDVCAEEDDGDIFGY